MKLIRMASNSTAHDRRIGWKDERKVLWIFKYGSCGF